MTTQWVYVCFLSASGLLSCLAPSERAFHVSPSLFGVNCTPENLASLQVTTPCDRKRRVSKVDLGVAPPIIFVRQAARFTGQPDVPILSNSHKADLALKSQGSSDFWPASHHVHCDGGEPENSLKLGFLNRSLKRCPQRHLEYSPKWVLAPRTLSVRTKSCRHSWKLQSRPLRLEGARTPFRMCQKFIWVLPTLASEIVVWKARGIFQEPGRYKGTPMKSIPCLRTSHLQGPGQEFVFCMSGRSGTVSWLVFGAFVRMLELNNFLPTNGFFTKPLKVKTFSRSRKQPQFDGSHV